ncbi:hypothetical protein CSUI_006905, partial [Cystoisospora suis]
AAWSGGVYERGSPAAVGASRSNQSERRFKPAEARETEKSHETNHEKWIERRRRRGKKEEEEEREKEEEEEQKERRKEEEKHQETPRLFFVNSTRQISSRPPLSPSQGLFRYTQRVKKKSEKKEKERKKRSPDMKKRKKERNEKKKKKKVFCVLEIWRYEKDDEMRLWSVETLPLREDSFETAEDEEEGCISFARRLLRDVLAHRAGESGERRMKKNRVNKIHPQELSHGRRKNKGDGRQDQEMKKTENQKKGNE